VHADGSLLSALKVQVDVVVSSPSSAPADRAVCGHELGYEAKVEVSPPRP